MIPDTISSDDLATLAASAKPGITLLSPEETKSSISTIVEQLTKLQDQLDSYQYDGLDRKREMFIYSGQQMLRVALRNLERSIAV